MINVFGFGKVSIYFFNKKIKKVKLYGKDGVYFLKKKWLKKVKLFSLYKLS